MTERIVEAELEAFHDSFERVTQRPDFLDAFYERFIGSDEAVAQKFDGVDLRRVKSKLRQSLLFTMMASDGNPAARERLEELGEFHAARGVEPAHYQLWLDALLSVVEEMDPGYDPQIERSWRRVLAVGISIMTAVRPSV